MINEAQKSREDMWDPLSEAYRALYDSYLKLGPMKLESVATSTPPTVDVTVNVRTIVSVNVPTMQITEKNVGLTYGFADTNTSLDKATRMMRNVLPGIMKAAEMENAIFRLATELEKTQRLLNALEYVIIPGYQGTIKFISATLEEREREEFVRLKHVKRILERKKEAGEEKEAEAVAASDSGTMTVVQKANPSGRTRKTLTLVVVKNLNQKDIETRFNDARKQVEQMFSDQESRSLRRTLRLLRMR